MGMSCASCSARVEKTLNRQPGVRRATVNYASATATVEYDSQNCSPEALQQADGDRAVAGDAGDLLLAFLAAFLLQTLQSGDRNAQELNDDGSVDVRLDAQSERGRLRESRAGHGVIQSEDRIAESCLEGGNEEIGVHVRNRYAAAKTIDQQYEEREEHLLAKLGDLPRITECCKHLHHLSLSACLFNFFLGRLGEGGCLHGDFNGDIAVAEDLQTILAGMQDALFDQSFRVHDGAVLKAVEAGYVHSRQRLCKNVVEAALRDAACQRHLAAFKADAELAARTGLLTLVSAACRLAVARCRAAALALIDMGGTHNRSKFV